MDFWIMQLHIRAFNFFSLRVGSLKWLSIREVFLLHCYLLLSNLVAKWCFWSINFLPSFWIIIIERKDKLLSRCSIYTVSCCYRWSWSVFYAKFSCFSWCLITSWVVKYETKALQNLKFHSGNCWWPPLEWWAPC